MKIFKIVLKIAPFFALLIFVIPGEFRDFGDYAWKVLLTIMFISPVRDVIMNTRLKHRFPFLKKICLLMPLRKELGIISGVLAIAHLTGFVLVNKIGFDFFLNSDFWYYKNFLFWGMLAFIFSLPPLFTSTIFAIKKLGIKTWKRVQYGAYFMLIFVAIHVYLIKQEFEPLIILGGWIGLKIFAFMLKKRSLR